MEAIEGLLIERKGCFMMFVDVILKQQDVSVGAEAQVSRKMRGAKLNVSTDHRQVWFRRPANSVAIWLVSGIKQTFQDESASEPCDLDPNRMKFKLTLEKEVAVA